MRRIVMFNRVAADGSFAGPGGSLDWVVPEEEFDKSVAENMPRRRHAPVRPGDLRDVRVVLAHRRR